MKTAGWWCFGVSVAVLLFGSALAIASGSSQFGVVWSVLVWLPWIGIVTGLALVITARRSRARSEKAPQTQIPAPNAQRYESPEPIDGRLESLDRLRAAGQISDDEHQEQRRRILNSL